MVPPPFKWVRPLVLQVDLPMWPDLTSNQLHCSADAKGWRPAHDPASVPAGGLKPGVYGGAATDEKACLCLRSTKRPPIKEFPQHPLSSLPLFVLAFPPHKAHTMLISPNKHPFQLRRHHLCDVDIDYYQVMRVSPSPTSPQSCKSLPISKYFVLDGNPQSKFETLGVKKRERERERDGATT